MSWVMANSLAGSVWSAVGYQPQDHRRCPSCRDVAASAACKRLRPLASWLGRLSWAAPRRAKGSVVYPPERNAKGQYQLWLTEAEANRLAALRRRGESYGDPVIRLAKAQD